MQGIEFETDNYGAPSTTTKTSWVIRWIMKMSGGYIKDERQASYVALGFVVGATALSFFLISGESGSKAKFEAPPGQEIIYPENAPPRLQEKF